jgi:hypothetical protein
MLISTAYLPPVSWMAVAVQQKNVCIEIHETYPKQTFRNRCNIATSAGILSLSVPVIRCNGNHTKTGVIIIDNSRNWQQMHWRSIVTAYSKSPYFFHYRDIFEPIYHKQIDRLIDLNQALLTIIFKTMHINEIEMKYSLEYDFNPHNIDLRDSFHPKRKPYQIIAYDLPRYIQTFEENHGYIADLSIIDLLFNSGPETLQYLFNLKLSFQDQTNGNSDIQP